MIAPPKPAEVTEDDDLGLDLPESESSVADDESWAPDDDSDFGLDTTEGNLGLDNETGLDEGDDDSGSSDEDDASWLEGELGTEDGEDESDADDEDGPSFVDERGAPPESGGDFDDDIAFEEADSVVSDSGDEGFTDDSVLNGLDLEKQLPALQTQEDNEEDADADAEALAAEILALPELDPDDVLAASSAALTVRSIELEAVHRGGRPLSMLTAAGETGVAWDGSLLVLEPDSARPERRFAAADAAYALCSVQTKNGLWIAIATPGGVLCSLDAGRSFAPLAALEAGAWAATALAISVDDTAVQLWAAPPRGALFRSADFGEHFVSASTALQVLRLASDGKRHLVALGRDESGAAAALQSHDAGAVLSPLALPVTELERIQDFQVCGEHMLCSRRGLEPQLVWASGNARFQDLFSDAAPPAVLIEEGGAVHVYCCGSAPSGRVLIRMLLGEASAQPEVVTALPDDAGAPLQLAGHHHDGVTTLQLGGERAWYRISVRFGERPA